MASLAPSLRGKSDVIGIVFRNRRPVRPARAKVRNIVGTRAARLTGETVARVVSEPTRDGAFEAGRHATWNGVNRRRRGLTAIALNPEASEEFSKQQRKHCN